MSFPDDRISRGNGAGKIAARDPVVSVWKIVGTENSDRSDRTPASNECCLRYLSCLVHFTRAIAGEPLWRPVAIDSSFVAVPHPSIAVGRANRFPDEPYR